MTPTVCKLMAQYHLWMNQRLYEAAAKLTRSFRVRAERQRL
jgi:uncharacterized damage-inducible protein DinB